MEIGGTTWKFHPLIVHPEHRMQGIGFALADDIEEQVASRGGRNIYLGIPDHDNQTSLAGRELYPDVLKAMQEFENRSGHAFDFYLKIGYSFVGLLPHAHGWGKPEIYMSKRLKAKK